MHLSSEDKVQLDKILLATKITGKLPGRPSMDARQLERPPRSIEEARRNFARNSCFALERWREEHARAYLASMGVAEPSAARRIIRYWQENVAVPLSQLIFDLMCGAEQ